MTWWTIFIYAMTGLGIAWGFYDNSHVDNTPKEIRRSVAVTAFLIVAAFWPAFLLSILIKENLKK